MPSNLSTLAPEHEVLIGMLKQLRRDRDLTLRQLAQDLGKHRNFVYKIEAGQRDVGVAELLEILRELKVEPAEFFQRFLEEVRSRAEPKEGPQRL